MKFRLFATARKKTLTKIVELQRLYFHRDGPEIILDNYAKNTYLVLDLASTQQSIHEIYHQETSGAPIRLDLEFSQPTATV